MNKNKLSKILSMFFIGTMTLASCTKDFEEANRPGECASEEELSRDNYNTGAFLKQMQNAAFPEQENDFQMSQDLIGNYLGRYMTYAADGFAKNNFARMNAPANWVRWPFAEITPRTVSAFKEVSRITGQKGLGYAWALVLRAQAFLRLTDMYGPLTIGAEEDPNAYSSQEKVYKSLVSDLDEAVFVMKSMVTDGKLSAFTDFDMVYGGDFVKWITFANSLKLRIAIRMRMVDPTFAKRIGEEAVAAGVITENSQNCTIFFNPRGLYKTSVDWGDTRACADIESYMHGYNDARLEKYFKPTEVAGERPIIGCCAGADVKNKKIADALYSACNVASDSRGIWMTAAEMTFCRAEGALAGWSGMGGSVGDLYNKAIALSFEQWGVGGAADSYVQDAVSKPADYVDAEGGYGKNFSAPTSITVKWNNGASLEEKMERLIVQKWIALFPDGQEAWNEIRRTGYPKVFPVVQSTAYDLNVPNRIPFDYTEKVNNAVNYANAVQLLGGSDDYSTKLWWQKNN